MGRLWLTVLLGLGLTASAAGQQLSPRADTAFWCEAAIYWLLDNEMLTNTEDLGPILESYFATELEEADKLKLSDDQVNAMQASYQDEIAVQLPDFVRSRDPAALRHDINACLKGE